LTQVTENRLTDNVRMSTKECPTTRPVYTSISDSNFHTDIVRLLT